MNITRAMQVYMAVCEHQGFAAAGRMLNISKAMVSRQISQLEDHLNVRLLNRTTRKISLTESGLTYLDHCREIMEQIGSMEDHLGQMSQVPQGILRVSVPQYYGQYYIVPLMAEFLRLYPEVRLDLMLSDHFVDLVQERFDMVVRIGDPLENTLIARKISQTCHGLYAAPAYVEKYGIPQSPEALKEHKCLVYEQGMNLRPWCFGSVELLPPYTIKSNSGEALSQMAADGLGLAFLPDILMKNHLDNGRVIEITLDKAPESSPILALYPSKSYMPLKLRVFIDFLVERLSG